MNSSDRKGSTSHSAWVWRVARLVLEEECFLFRRSFKLIATVVLLTCSLESLAVGRGNEMPKRSDSDAMLGLVCVQEIDVEVDPKLGCGLNRTQFGVEGRAKLLGGNALSVELGDFDQVSKLPVRKLDGKEVSDPRPDGCACDGRDNLVRQEAHFPSSSLRWIVAFAIGLIGGGELVMWLSRRFKKPNVRRERHTTAAPTVTERTIVAPPLCVRSTAGLGRFAGQVLPDAAEQRQPG